MFMSSLSFVLISFERDEWHLDLFWLGSERDPSRLLCSFLTSPFFISFLRSAHFATLHLNRHAQLVSE